MEKQTDDERIQAEKLIDAFIEFAQTSCEKRAKLSALIDKTKLFNTLAAKSENTCVDTTEAVDYICDTVMAMSHAAARSKCSGEEATALQVEIFNKYMSAFKLCAKVGQYNSKKCIVVTAEPEGKRIRLYYPDENGEL